MNQKFSSDNRRRLSETAPNTVGGHRGVYVGGTRGGEQWNWSAADAGATATPATNSSGSNWGYIPGTGYTVTPGSTVPVAPSHPDLSFFEKYKKPLLIGTGILTASALIYIAVKKL